MIKTVMNSSMVSVLSLSRVFFIRSYVDIKVSSFLGFFLLRGMNWLVVAVLLESSSKIGSLSFK